MSSCGRRGPVPAHSPKDIPGLPPAPRSHCPFFSEPRGLAGLLPSRCHHLLFPTAPISSLVQRRAEDGSAAPGPPCSHPTTCSDSSPRAGHLARCPVQLCVQSRGRPRCLPSRVKRPSPRPPGLTVSGEHTQLRPLRCGPETRDVPGLRDAARET